MSDLEKAKEKGLIQVFEFLKLFPSIDSIEESVKKLKSNNNKMSQAELSRKIINKACWTLTGAGVVASLPGAIPGLGTLVQIGVDIGSMTSETWLILRNLTSMQMIIAGIHGHDLYHDDRKDELLIIWGLETGAIVPAKEAGKRIGTKIAVKQFDKRISGELFKKINTRLGGTVLTKWGTKRGGVAIGRIIPFGIGAAIGGGMNYAAAKGFGVSCLKYYSEILPGNEEIIV